MSSVQLATAETELKDKKEDSTIADQQPPVEILPTTTELKDRTENVRVLSSLRVLLLGLLLVGTGAAGFYYLPGRCTGSRGTHQSPCLISHRSICLATCVVPGMIKDDAGGSRVVNSIYCSAITLTTYVSRSCLYWSLCSLNGSTHISARRFASTKNWICTCLQLDSCPCQSCDDVSCLRLLLLRATFAQEISIPLASSSSSCLR
jgi:hypothetical protein